MPEQQDKVFHATFIHDLPPMQGIFSTLLKGEKVLKSAGTVSDKFNSLGVHSIVGERGAQLSGGQRQRIMIARALAHRPRLLMLDEATSALDPASTASICETLEKLRGDITILAISHQPALVSAADRVYRLQEGRAVLIGTQWVNQLYPSKDTGNKMG